MGIISDLSDDLLVKILSYVPIKVAVSTSILSKQWQFLWMWLPKLEFNDHVDIYKVGGCEDISRRNSLRLMYQDFIVKNLPLHRAQIIERFCLEIFQGSLQPEDIKLCVGIAVSRCVRELSVCCYQTYYEPDGVVIVFPIGFYTCKSLVTLKLYGEEILVDVPPLACLPSLTTLDLECVTYLNEDSLPLLLSCCPVLEDLVIQRDKNDNMKALVVIVPSLQRLSLWIRYECPFDGFDKIDTPSLKYFKASDSRDDFSYSIKHMPRLEEADIYVEQNVEELLKPITSVKRLSLYVLCNNRNESKYDDSIIFNQLEHLKLQIIDDYWSELVVRLLKDSPKLRVLNLYGLNLYGCADEEYNQPDSLEGGTIPKCLGNSLEAFEFTGYKGRQEERNFLSFLFKYACRLTSISILPGREAEYDSE